MHYIFLIVSFEMRLAMPNADAPIRPGHVRIGWLVVGFVVCCLRVSARVPGTDNSLEVHMTNFP